MAAIRRFLFVHKLVRCLAFFAISTAVSYAQGAEQGILALKGIPLEQLPAVYKSKGGPKYQIYWKLENCRKGFHDCSIQIERFAEVEQLVETELDRVTKKFDSWASLHVPAWQKHRQRVFPIRLIFDENPGSLPRIGVEIGDVESKNQNLLIGQKRPEITAPIVTTLSNPKTVTEALAHEFGHILHFEAGVSSLLFSETLADMTNFIINDSPFILPSMVSIVMEANVQPPLLTPGFITPFRPEVELLARLPTKNGIRDFTSNVNLTFDEVYTAVDPYLVSSMINRTLYLMGQRISWDLMGKVMFELIWTNPRIFFNPDLSQFMNIFKDKIQKIDPTVDMEYIDSCFQTQQWQQIPTIAESPHLSVVKRGTEHTSFLDILNTQSRPSYQSSNRIYILYVGNQIKKYIFCAEKGECYSQFGYTSVMVGECKDMSCFCLNPEDKLSVQVIYSEGQKIKKTSRQKLNYRESKRTCYN